jgi:hypothetical protein
MTKIVSALFDHYYQAERAADALAEAGFARDTITVIVREESHAANKPEVTVVNDEDVKGDEGAAFGTVTGAVIGLGAMLIPGIGPVIAGGPLVAALIGGGIGAIAGGITGGITASLVKLGVDEEAAEYYAEGLKRGGTMVSVTADESMAERAADVLNAHNPVDQAMRTAEWREQGWTRFSNDMVDGTIKTLTN